MSRALMQHDLIFNYSTIWMDSIRNGTFGLTNTNRLVRFYRGATGLKTGSTEKAGFCVSVTAERDSLSLICVIMGAQSRDIRNAQATRLLDWGFANYASYICDSVPLDAIRVTGGQMQACAPQLQPFSITLPKNQIQKVTYEIKLPQTIAAPICEGDELGCVTFRIGEQDIGTAPLVAAQSIPRITYLQLLKSLLCGVVLK
jgi:D-alanyl-D-alanine carboxypeptidase (penicillin-binding protein 5/6)